MHDRNLDRELAELGDPRHPRRDLSPMAELALMDRKLRGHRVDEHRSVVLSDAHDRTPDEAVGSRRDDGRPFPVDDNLEDAEPGMGLLAAIEPIESDDKLLDFF